MTESTTGLDDSYLYDQLRHPDGSIVYMPCSNRQQYLAAGFTLLAPKAWDYRQQMDADWGANRNRGLQSDHGNPTGPTAPFPAS